jgi:hypothetical protein
MFVDYVRRVFTDEEEKETMNEISIGPPTRAFRLILSKYYGSLLFPGVYL